MFGSMIFDVLIGLVLVFLLMSLICSTIQEQIAGTFHQRAKTLMRGIQELLRDDELVEAFYQHPRIWSLYRGDYDEAKKTGKLPSYIPSNAFSAAIIDIVARGRDPNQSLHSGPESPVISLPTLRRNIGNLGNAHVQRVVLAAIDSAQGDLAKVQQSIEAWFDGTMDRTSGWYKRQTQRTLFVVAAVLTVILDVDAIEIARDFYRDPARREAAVAMAAAATQESRRPASGTAGDTTARRAKLDSLAGAAMDRLNSLGIPIGWSDVKTQGFPTTAEEWNEIWKHLRHAFFGWFLTAIAVSFGAPFWFDLLNKVMVIRSTVKPREKSQEEGSEDRRSDRRGATSPAATNVVIVPGTQGVAGTAAALATAPASNGEPKFQPHEWSTGHGDGGVI
jgi:hypothetical protein